MDLSLVASANSPNFCLIKYIGTPINKTIRLVVSISCLLFYSVTPQHDPASEPVH